jgi:tetratricopeptide (TPR) repeat protein
MSSRVDENSDPFETAALATDFVGTSMIGSQTFMTLASALAEVEHSDKSKELFDAAIQSARIEDPKSRGRTFSNIARALTHAQFFDKAEQVVNSIKDPELRAQITKEVAAGLTKAQLYDEAERVARSIKHSEPRAGALYTLATAFADAYRFGEAKQLFDEAKQITYSIKDFEDRSKALRDISRIVDPQQILAEVEHLKIVGDAALRVRCLCNLAVALAKVQFREESKQVFQKAEQATFLTGPKLRPYSRSRIARQLIYTQFFDEAEEISRTIDLPKLRCQILSDIAVRLTQAQLSDRPKYLFEEAKETALLIQDFKVRSETIRHIAIGLIKANFLDDAVVVARELSTSDLVLVLDQYAQLRRSEALKTYILSLCYELDYALQGCAQMILLYEDQTESIISEISKSSLM